VIRSGYKKPERQWALPQHAPMQQYHMVTMKTLPSYRNFEPTYSITVDTLMTYLGYGYQ
jgi:hypothetical protein